MSLQVRPQNSCSDHIKNILGFERKPNHMKFKFQYNKPAVIPRQTYARQSSSYTIHWLCKNLPSVLSFPKPIIKCLTKFIFTKISINCFDYHFLAQLFHKPPFLCCKLNILQNISTQSEKHVS